MSARILIVDDHEVVRQGGSQHVVAHPAGMGNLR
jgi:ABC-type proline/glycine betaine transport system ATPase subunit